MDITNYRPYYGNQRLSFDYSPDKNFTVILANNGSGKTSILNAFTWCLYGKELHDNRDKEKPLYNKIAASESDNDSIDVKIEIKFYEIEKKNKIPFIITRKQNFIKSKDKFIKNGKSSLEIKYDTEIKWDDSTLIKQLIPEKMHNYFFFNGETLAGYFDNQSDVNLKNSVEELSQLYLIENMFDHINKVKSSYNKDISQKGNRDVNAVITSIKQKEKDKKVKLDRINELNETIENCSKNIRNCENNLRELDSQNLEKLQNQRDDLEDEQRELKNKIMNAEEEYAREIILTYPLVKLFDILVETLGIEDKLREKKQLPAPIKKNFLKDILESGECICGTDLSKNQDAYDKIYKLMEDTSETTNKDITGDFFKIKSSLESIKTHYNRILKLRKEMKPDKNLYKKNGNDLKNISQKISSSNIRKASEFEAQRKMNDRKKIDSENEKKTLESHLSNFDSELKNLIDRKNKITAENKEVELINKKINFCDDAVENIELLNDRLKGHIRMKINEKTREQFVNIDWSDNKFTDVLIDENYDIKVKEKDESLIKTGDLSGGEEALLALSFMIALHNISGFNLPIFIDAPLEKLDLTKGDDFIGQIHSFTNHKQITFLLTDRQYTSKIKAKMSPNISNEYELIPSYNKTEIVNNGE